MKDRMKDRMKEENGESNEFSDQVECVVDGGWGDWSEFGACSVTCASGVRRRERKCDFPVPKNGGKQCVGECE